MKKRIINIIKSGLLGLAFFNTPLPYMQQNALAACSDTAAPGVDWHNCRKRNLIMDGFNFTGADFTRADLSASDLRNTNLNKATFFKTNLVRASLAGSTGKNTNFGSIVASRTNFSKGDYENANFQKAEINRSNFSDSILTNTNMSKGDFSRVNFFNSNLKGANFSFSNISRANFVNASLDTKTSFKGAYTYLTNITGVDLSIFDDLEQWQINMACGDEKTKLPAGFATPSNWPCKYEED